MFIICGWRKRKLLKNLKNISHANALGFQVLVDISPSVFEQLGISYNDLSFFHELVRTVFV